VVAGGDRPVGLDLEALDAREVVVVLEDAEGGVEGGGRRGMVSVSALSLCRL